MSLLTTLQNSMNVSFFSNFIAIPSSKATAGQYGIECKFGRFGVGMGVYLNKTTIKCVTPSV
jgi:hypothetical protein